MLRRRHELLGLSRPARLPVLLTALVAIAWIGLVVWALVSGSWGDSSGTANAVVVVLGAFNAAALGSAALWLRSQQRQSHLWAVLVLIANAALTLTDQMGWFDTLYLALTIAALVAVLIKTRWYWRRAARRGRH